MRNKAEVSNTTALSSKHDPATKRSETSEPIVSSSSAKLSAPLFTKKVKSLDRVKFGKQKTDSDQTTNLEDSKEVKDAEKNGGSSHVCSVKEVKNLETRCPSNPFSKLPNIQEGKKVEEATRSQSEGPSNKSSNEEAKKVVGEVTGKQCQRPSNPFLKSKVK